MPKHAWRRLWYWYELQVVCRTGQRLQPPQLQQFLSHANFCKPAVDDKKFHESCLRHECTIIAWMQLKSGGCVYKSM